jgi:hypothetical protein
VTTCQRYTAKAPWGLDQELPSFEQRSSRQCRSQRAKSRTAARVGGRAPGSLTCGCVPVQLAATYPTPSVRSSFCDGKGTGHMKNPPHTALAVHAFSASVVQLASHAALSCVMCASEACGSGEFVVLLCCAPQLSTTMKPCSRAATCSENHGESLAKFLLPTHS